MLTSYERRLTKHLYEIFSLGVQLYDCLLETMVAEAAFCYATIQKTNMVKYSYRNKGMVILMEFIIVALLSICFATFSTWKHESFSGPAQNLTSLVKHEAKPSASTACLV